MRSKYGKSRISISQYFIEGLDEMQFRGKSEIEYDGTIYSFDFNAHEYEIIIGNTVIKLVRDTYHRTMPKELVKYLSIFIIDALIEGITVDDNFINEVFKKVIHINTVVGELNVVLPSKFKIYSFDGRYLNFTRSDNWYTEISLGYYLVEWKGKTCKFNIKINRVNCIVPCIIYFDNIVNMILQLDEVDIDSEYRLYDLILKYTPRKYNKSARNLI